MKIVPESFRDKSKPHVVLQEWVDKIKLPADAEEKKKVRAFIERFDKNDVTYLVNEFRSSSSWEMVNMHLSQCHSCNGFSIWVRDGLVYPAHDVAILPHDDMPKDVRIDFVEAGEIIDKSPRGAAALLRLAIQKLMPHLEEGGSNREPCKKGLRQEGATSA